MLTFLFIFFLYSLIGILKGKLSLLSVLFIYSCNHFYHKFLFYSLINNPVLSLFLVCLWLFQLWSWEALSGWLLCSFEMFCLCAVLILFFCLLAYSTFTFWHHKMIRIHLVLSPPPPWKKTTYPSNFITLYWKMEFINQYVDARCIHCFWCVTASRYSQCTELGNIRMQTFPCALSICACILHILNIGT